MTVILTVLMLPLHNLSKVGYISSCFYSNANLTST